MELVGSVSVDNSREMPVIKHKITAHNVLYYLNGTLVQWEALVKAVATRRAHDDNIKRIIASYQTALYQGNNFIDKLDEVTKAVFDKATWILAKTILVDPPDDYIDKLQRLKSIMFGFPTHIDAGTCFPSNILDKLRSYTNSILEESLKDIPQTQCSLAVSTEPTETFFILTDLVRMAEKHFPKLQDEASKTFEKWSNRLFEMNDPRFLNSAAKFAFAAFALWRLSVSNCLHKNTGFVDGGDPKVSYVYLCMEKLAVEKGYNSYKLSKCIYTGALQIADELAAHKTLQYDIVEAVNFTIQILDNVLGDIMADHTYTPPRHLYENVFVGMEVPCSPAAYDTACMEGAEASSQSKATMRAFDQQMEEKRQDEYVGALLSYPSVKMATKYAKPNGYLSFADAHTDLGAGVYYAEESEFVQKARVKCKASRKRGYESIK